MTGLELIALTVIGLFAGVVGGMLGVGGSLVMIPAMTEVLGPNQHLYQAAAMIVNFCIVVPAVLYHRRVGAIEAGIVARLIPIAGLAVIAGVTVSELPFFHDGGEAYLRALFGTFLLYFAGSELYFFVISRAMRRRILIQTDAVSVNAPPTRVSPALAVALPTGFVAGLLGVGGGVLAVPLQVRFLRIPIRRAVANSAAIIVATSLIGATLKNFALLRSGEHGLRSFILAAVLIPTAIVGSMIGSRLTHAAPVKLVRLAFFVMLMAAGLRMAFIALRPG